MCKKSFLNTKMELTDVNFFQRKRYIVAFLISCGLSIQFILRTNLSIAMIEMCYDKKYITNNGNVTWRAEFQWSAAEKGLLISSFSWGYFFSSLGGILAIKYGGATIYGLGIGMTGILTISTPFLVRTNFYAYLGARVMEGLFEGFAKASTGELFARWAPEKERTRFILFAEIGAPLGTAVGYPLSSFLAAKYNWEAIFYYTGIVSLIWYSIWLTLVRSYPEIDTMISKKEKTYLQHSTSATGHEKISYPWKKMLTSKPLLAYLNDRFVESWSLSFILYCIPFYIKDVHDASIQNIGVLTMLPTLLSVITLLLGSFAADYLRCSQIISISNVHKLFITTGQIFAITSLVILILTENFVICISCLCSFRVFYAIANVSYTVLPVDMAAGYASLIFGMATTCLSFGYFLNPIIMNAIVSNHTIGEWNSYFLFLCAFNIWGGIIFLFFGSGKLQPWAVPK